MKKKGQTRLNRNVALILCLATLLALTGCGKNPVESETNMGNAEEVITQLAQQSTAYGFDNALSELTEQNKAAVDGDSYYRFQQNYQGLPVYGKTLVYVTDKKGNTISITGNVQDVDETIDLTPTISADTVVSVVNQFFKDTYGPEVTVLDSLDLSENDLCIFEGSTDQKSHLAYAITQNGYELVIDAHDGSLLQSNCLLRWATVVDLEGQIASYENVLVSEDNGEYRLADEGRKITSFKAKHTEVSKLWGLVKYQVNINNDADEIVWQDGGNPPADAVDAYVNTQIAYDYFEQVLGNAAPDGEGLGQILLLSGIQYTQEEDGEISTKRINNAASGTDLESKATVLFFGVGTGWTPARSAYFDWVAHEYMHAVEAYHSSMNYAGESGAIMEGLSDIFGELVESWVTRQEPNWIFSETKRNMRDPGSGGYPASVNEKDKNAEGDYVHSYSTIVSHAAYLMWNGIDGNNSKKLSNDELAELWYRAMLMMPSDCDFILCRQLVEVAAQSMETLDDEQRACVREAFNRVEIPSTREDTFYADYRLNEDATLTVYDQNNEPYSGYTLRINGTIDMSEIASNMTPDIGWVVNRTNTVEEAGAYALDLPQGCYSLTISDPHYDESYTIYVEISDEYTETNIDLITAYEEPLIVIIPQRKQLTRIDKYDQSGSVVNHKVFSYNDFGFLEEEVSRDIEQGECVFELQTTFTYDGNNRLISRITENPEYPGESSGVKYTYDNLGRITGSMAWEGGAVELLYEYDSQNRVIRTTEMYDAGSSVTEHTYDDRGRLIKDVRVSCEEWSNDTWTDTTVYSYDAEGRLSSTVMEGAYQTVTQVYDYSYLPFVIVDYCYNGSSHYFYAMLPDGSLDMMTTMVFEDPQFYTDEEGYLAKVIDNDDYWGTCVYEFYYNDEIAIPENGPFRVQTGEASESHTYDEAEALLYEHLVQIYGSDGLDVTQVNSAVYNGITLQMTISGESGAPIYVIEWYTVDLETGVVTKSETGSYVCDLW